MAGSSADKTNLRLGLPKFDSMARFAAATSRVSSFADLILPSLRDPVKMQRIGVTLIRLDDDFEVGEVRLGEVDRYVLLCKNDHGRRCRRHRSRASGLAHAAASPLRIAGVAIINLITPGTVDADIDNRYLSPIGVFQHAGKSRLTCLQGHWTWRKV